MISNLTRWQRMLLGASGATIVVALFFVSFAAAAAQLTPARIAYISVGRIAAQSTETQASAKKLQQFREEKMKAVNEKQKQLQALQLEGAQLGGMFQASKRAKVKADEDRTRAELQKLESDAQAELQKMQRDAQVEFQKRLGGVIDALAKERGADLVLNQDVSIVWARGGMDLTAEAIQRVNAAAQAAPPAPTTSTPAPK